MTVSDIASTALYHVQQRLGPSGSSVAWRCGDILEDDLPAASFDVWHDRAVFHFLTSQSDRDRYIAQVMRAVKPHGHVIVATFAENGPSRCSGLEVVRYSPAGLHAQFGSHFTLLESVREDHVTPGGSHQPFQYCLCEMEV